MQKYADMVFCFQNCSDLLWEKIVLVIEKNSSPETEPDYIPDNLTKLRIWTVGS